MRDGTSFTDVFAENHNIKYSAKQLKYLEKQTVIFLLNLFTDIYQNLSKSKIVLSNVRLKSKIYELPILEVQVDVKILAIAWNTAHPLKEDKYCDLEDCVDLCEVGCILICEHAYHFECFLFKLGSQCQYCTDYLVSGIKKNCQSYQKTLTSFNKIATNEGRDENVIEPIDDTIIGSEDLSLDNNIDLLFERTVNALTNV